MPIAWETARAVSRSVDTTKSTSRRLSRQISAYFAHDRARDEVRFVLRRTGDNEPGLADAGGGELPPARGAPLHSRHVVELRQRLEWPRIEIDHCHVVAGVQHVNDRCAHETRAENEDLHVELSVRRILGAAQPDAATTSAGSRESHSESAAPFLSAVASGAGGKRRRSTRAGRSKLSGKPTRYMRSSSGGRGKVCGIGATGTGERGPRR